MPDVVVKCENCGNPLGKVTTQRVPKMICTYGCDWPASTKHTVRNKAIRDAVYEDKKPIIQVAEEFKMTRQRVYQILKDNISKT